MNQLYAMIQGRNRDRIAMIAPSQALAVALVICASIFGCAQKEEVSNVESSARLDQILREAPNDAARELWLKAHAAGDLPDLDTLSMPNDDEKDVTRTRQMAAKSERRELTLTRPAISADTIGEVLFFSPAPVLEYQGPFIVRKASPGSIVGTAPGERIPWEILYKLPDDLPALQIAEGVKTILTHDVKGDTGSLRRLHQLQTTTDKLILLYLADGDKKPYRRSFQELSLLVSQEEPDAQNVAAVTITINNQRETLKPGESARYMTAQGELEAFLLSSYYTRSPGSFLEEGDPYYVRVMVYPTGP